MSKNNSSLKSETDWARLDAMLDKEIDYSDIPELTAEEFKRARPAQEFFAERGISYNPNEPHQVTEFHEDGTISTYDSQPAQRVIILDPDVQMFFADSETVNRVLRSLIALIPQVD